MKKTQITEKIKLIEQSIQNTKASLKNWANQIGEYHKALKEITNQLATIKEQITMKNNNSKTLGGNN